MWILCVLDMEVNMQASGNQMHSLVHSPWFRQHFNMNNCVEYWCSQVGINVTMPCNEMYGHFKNNDIELRFDTAWLNQFGSDPGGDKFNFVHLKDYGIILLRNLSYQNLILLLQSNL